MILKRNRADKKAIEIVFKTGKSFSSPNLNFKFILNNNSNIPRISFIVPKTVSKKAVKRNLLKRRGYNILRKYISQLPAGVIGILVFKKYQASPIGLRPREDILIIENEIKNLLNKIN
ncbi:ribonuclease P protein component [Candidatus Nomurabacteria bacterium RIFCSPLOWO2_01_FULL_41_12]|uniref:Ribonuclease P protein component n=1 Tax=Candidatus Nomurabacteria bacterium RIFCSPLOWO2_01_FULL_41_12 TaxID=1801774 RepID=A0A1F6WX78_9BACT|nr:MAG: ribonuclease P protein component [Candidatus Nomurabacteria bacterium RIFCSPHIGHO2_01_FULL_40_10]OGI86355.1 MAG: ribonuclease P protein component [Candidatus Nomurabacteria bacterium RIFCSPLOWO2_01_FULL_41_12]